MHTFDANRTGGLENPGQMLGGTFKTKDASAPDGSGYRTYDSTGAFLVGELERLDQTLNLPLVEVSWGRDIDLREDVTLADEYSSYTNTRIASQGGLGTGNGIGTGKAWMGKDSTQIAGASVDIQKTPNPLNIWAFEVKYSIPELTSAAKLGRPIDAQKVDTMELKRQMDIDEQVYIGDLSLNIGGLYNSASVTTVTNFPAGASGHTQWAMKTPYEILADVNFAINTVWAASGWKIKPTRILLPPAVFGYITMAQVAQAAGQISIRKYIEENNLINSDSKNGARLVIEACKWGIGTGAGGTIGTLGTVDRMVVYTKEYKYVRFPMTMQSRTPVQYEGLYHKWYYWMRMGGIEIPYANTIGYFDGL
jgi:hypothetical protein